MAKRSGLLAILVVGCSLLAAAAHASVGATTVFPIERDLAFLLLLIGVGALAIEAMHPGISGPGILGALTLLAALVVARSPSVNIHVPLPVILLAGAGVVVIVAVVVRAVTRARRAPHAHKPKAELIGQMAIVETVLDPTGVVRACGESWSAHAAVPAPEGAQVRITGVSGLLLEVEPLERSEVV